MSRSLYPNRLAFEVATLGTVAVEGDIPMRAPHVGQVDRNVGDHQEDAALPAADESARVGADTVYPMLPFGTTLATSSHPTGGPARASRRGKESSQRRC